MFALVLQQICQTFLHFLWDVMPFFIGSVAFGALLESYLKLDFLFRYLKKGPLSIFFATCLGALLPGCACASVPMSDTIKARGGSVSTVSSFLMVSPVLGPHTVFLTFGVLGLDFAIGRVLFGIGGALFLGLLLLVIETRGWLRYPGEASAAEPLRQDHEMHHEHSGHAHGGGHCCAVKVTFWGCFGGMMKRLGGYFLVGILIASVLSVLVPPAWVANFALKTGHFAPVITAFLGIPIYVCEGEEIPITMSLLALGLPKGASFSFMMGSVGTCIPTFLMAKKIIGNHATLIYVGVWLVMTPIAGILFGLATKLF